MCGLYCAFLTLRHIISTFEMNFNGILIRSECSQSKHNNNIRLGEGHFVGLSLLSILYKQTDHPLDPIRWLVVEGQVVTSNAINKVHNCTLSIDSHWIVLLQIDYYRFHTLPLIYLLFFLFIGILLQCDKQTHFM